mmetsp:Transcript_14323/g.32584  ORF Transcript_14323/g.32584 Transcript_14323/m.32584 type:complete len:159 (-) Transcript_14323:41-517(-)
MFTNLLTFVAAVALAVPDAVEVPNDDQKVAQEVEALTAALAEGIQWSNESLALQQEMENDQLGITDLPNETDEDIEGLDLSMESPAFLALLEKEVDQEVEAELAALETGEAPMGHPEWLRGTEEMDAEHSDEDFGDEPEAEEDYPEQAYMNEGDAVIV